MRKFTLFQQATCSIPFSCMHSVNAATRPAAQPIPFPLTTYLRTVTATSGSSLTLQIAKCQPHSQDTVNPQPASPQVKNVVRSENSSVITSGNATSTYNEIHPDGFYRDFTPSLKCQDCPRSGCVNFHHSLIFISGVKSCVATIFTYVVLHAITGGARHS